MKIPFASMPLTTHPRVARPRRSAAQTTEPCYSARLLVPFLSVTRGSAVLPETVIATLTELDPDQRIHISYVHALLEDAEHRMDDPTLGLRASAAMTTGDAGMFDFLMTSAETPRQAIAAGGRYLRLISDAHDLRLTVGGERAFARFESRLPVPRAGEDFAIASLIRNHVFRWPEGMLEQTHAWFRHDAPVDAAPYHEALGPVHLHFAAEISAIDFPAAFLDEPLRNRDSRLHSVLCAAAENTLAEIPAGASLGERIRSLMSRELGSGDIALSAIARQMKLHPRKLSRTLAREGVSYDELLEAVRRELAMHLLAHTNVTISEIAHQTGFAGRAPFHRAFRRWTGETPLGMRRKRQAMLDPLDADG